MIEHATLLGQLIHYTTLLLLGHSFGIRSSYLFAIGLVALLSAIGINDYVLCRGGEQRRVHLAAYIILQVRPLDPLASAHRQLTNRLADAAGAHTDRAATARH